MIATGTGGIGESTAKELFIRAPQPKAYIVGRYLLFTLAAAPELCLIDFLDQERRTRQYTLQHPPLDKPERRSHIPEKRRQSHAQLR